MIPAVLFTVSISDIIKKQSLSSLFDNTKEHYNT